MSKISDEIREWCEVAHRLCSVTEEDLRWASLGEIIGYAVGAPCIGDNGEIDEMFILHRLADLIDPTCHKQIPSEMEGNVFCSNCGAEIGEYGVPNY